MNWIIDTINSSTTLFCLLISILSLTLYLEQTGSLIPIVDASRSIKNYTFLMALDSPNSGGEETDTDDLLPQPEGIDVDRDGNVFVNEIGENRINIFDPNGTLISTSGSSGDDIGQFSHPHGNEVEDENNQSASEVFVYIADQNNDRIQKFSKDGTFINKWGSEGTADGQFIQPWDVSVSQDDRIFVPDYGNDRIQIFSKDGNFITAWGALGSGPGQFDGPAVVAFDSEGNVYVTDSGNHRVQKFTSNGTYITEWGEEGQENGQFFMPEGLAVDPLSSNVYVSDTSNNNVQVFSHSGN